MEVRLALVAMWRLWTLKQQLLGLMASSRNLTKTFGVGIWQKYYQSDVSLVEEPSNVPLVENLNASSVEKVDVP